MMRGMPACGLASRRWADIEWQTMIRFSLFGVQVSIHPTLWLTLAILGRVDLLTPINILLYQLVWIIPGFIVTMWTRAI